MASRKAAWCVTRDAKNQENNSEEVVRNISSHGLKSMRSEDIGKRKRTEKERPALRLAASRQLAGDDSSEGHLTRINDILTNLMEAERKAEFRR